MNRLCDCHVTHRVPRVWFLCGSSRSGHQLSYLDKTHADGAHLGQLIDDLEAVVHGLSQQLREELVVEDLETAATWDLADGGRVEAVLVVAVPALHEDAAVAHALGVDLAPDVVQVDACEAKAALRPHLRNSDVVSPLLTDPCNLKRDDHLP